MAVIDSLKILLGIDPTGVTRGMRQAETRIQSGVSNIVNNILAPLTGAFALGGLFNNFISNADKLGLLADKLRMDVGEIDAWSAAVEAAGGSADAFQGTLKSFSDNLRNAAFVGGGGGVEWLQYLGISAVTAEGHLKNLTDVLPALATRLEGMSKLKSQYILQKLGLDEGTIRLVQKGRRSVDDLVTSMRLFAYSQEDADVAREFASSLSVLRRGAQAVANILFRAVTPAITAVSNEFIKIVGFLRQHETFVLTFLSLLTAYSLKFLAAWAANPVVLAILAIIAIIVLLALAIDDLITYIRGDGNTVLGKFWSRFGTGKEIAEKLSRAWERLKEIGKALFDTLLKEIQHFVSFFEPALKPLIKIIEGIFDLIGSIMDGEWEDAGKALRKVFEGLGQFVARLFDGVGRYIIDMVNRLWEWISSLDFKELWKKFTGSAKEFFTGFLGDDEESKQAAMVKPGDDSPLNDSIFGAAGYVAPPPKGSGVLSTPQPMQTTWARALPVVAQVMGEASAPVQALHGAERTRDTTSAKKGDTNIDANLHIGTFTVNTAATNADGTFDDAATAFYQQYGKMLYPAQSGVNVK